MRQERGDGTVVSDKNSHSNVVILSLTQDLFENELHTPERSRIEVRDDVPWEFLSLGIRSTLWLFRG